MKKTRLPSLLALVVAGVPLFACADQMSQNGGGGGATNADLQFLVDIGKFLFFRVGTGGYPTASGTVDTVTLNPALVIPPGAVTASNGNNTSVDWNGVVPAFNTPSVALPVEVRSNAGQVTLRATATALLNSGANNIPLSQILLTTSDANLPAPTIPNAGTGPAVNVVPSGSQNLVTLRAATWTFSYTPVITQRAGQYNGQVTFTASSP